MTQQWDDMPVTQEDRGTTRRDLLIGGALLTAAGTAYARIPRRTAKPLGKDQLEAMVPKTIGQWQFETTSGLVLPPSDQLRDRIYSQLLTRTYSAPDGSQLMVLMAYSPSQDGVIQIHRPEVCYPASGYRLTTNRLHDLRLGPVEVPTRFIVAESETRREQLMYWTRLGQHIPSNWRGQRTAVISENLAGRIPDGILVRFSTVGNADAGPMLDSFAQTLFAAAGTPLRQLLIGPDPSHLVTA